MGIPSWRLFWAKTDRTGTDPNWTRPLWAHLIDVANAAELLWEVHLPATLRRQLSEALGLDEAAAGHTLAIWIGLHDIGKAIPAFQAQHRPTAELLDAAGLHSDPVRRDSKMLHHGHASIAIIYNWLRANDSIPRESIRLMESMAAFVGFHHGKLWEQRGWRDCADARNGALGGNVWQEAQRQLINVVLGIWGVEWPRFDSVNNPWPTWLLGFAGWTTLADWIGSMAEHYPDVNAGDNIEEYIDLSRAGARQAIHDAGLDLHCALTTPPFLDLFGDNGRIDAPRPLQDALINLPLSPDDAPMLTIVEAPTGEGKTEAALYLAARQQAQRLGGGIYMAMPTQATSNGLFDRFRDFLAHAHDARGGAVNLLLVHGNSLLHPAQQKMLDRAADSHAWRAIYNDDHRTEALGEGRVGTAAWFLPKKRSLLAPYGIGTVDQALLGILFAKHFFLRLYGLAGKTVIFDEVHAYDIYMAELFVQLLSWLRELGTHVIVLSATLPERMRIKFLRAWGVAVPPTVSIHDSYPIVWSAGNGEILSTTFAATRRQVTRLEWHDPEPESIVETVVAAVRAGATVAVIVNTVDRAQTIFRALKDYAELGLGNDDLLLFHARFPFVLRQQTEHRVLDRFGRSRPSGRPGVLVATQVAEQSLDLDVDLMLSDLAPVDLLLQRAGRLHRHAHHNRPAGFTEPILHILVADASDGDLPEVKEIGGGGVYDPSTLWRTWWLLQGRKGWSLPEDYRVLIEGVYAGEPFEPPEELGEEGRRRWLSGCEKYEQDVLKHEREAYLRRIQSPARLKEMVVMKKPELADEEEEGVHRHMQAVTRLGEPSIDVVCLHRGDDNELYLDPECRHPAPLRPPLSREEIVSLQNNALRISSKSVVPFLVKQIEPGWAPVAEATPAVRRHRVLIFRNGLWDECDAAHIEFDTTLGLIIHRQRR